MLLFHLTRSLDPIAFLGEGTQWTSVAFARDNGEEVIAVADRSGRSRQWRYFANTHDLVEFSMRSLPCESRLDTAELSRDTPVLLTSAPITLSPTDEQNLRGIVKWITKDTSTPDDVDTASSGRCRS